MGLFAILMPVLGSLIIGLMARYGSEKIRGHGIPEALEAILFGKSVMQPKVAILKPLSSAISIGSGGPFGAEGPIIMTGGAFGSIVAQRFSLSSTERKVLLVAGAAAGMSVTFAAPIAAVLLAVELLLFEWRPRSLIPVALASFLANMIRPYLLGAGPLFPIAAHPEIQTGALFLSCFLGIACGAFATLLSVTLYKVEDGFHKLPIHWMWWPAIGGLVVGLGGYFQPRALGVGYDVIGDLLQNHITLSVAAGLLFVKATIWIFSLGSGTSGGVLAPLLMMGAGLGLVFSYVIPEHLASGVPWALIAMSAILGGMMRAPFTACVFALELTHDMSSMPAAFIASIAAYAFTVLVLKRSILTEKVARRGFDIYREYGVDPLENLRVKEIIHTNVITISEGASWIEAQNLFFKSSKKHQAYPVVDAQQDLIGIVSVSDLMDIESGVEAGFKVRDIMKKPITIHQDSACKLAAELLASHSIGRLPVIDSLNPKKIVGIISRSDLLKARLRDVKEETHREAPAYQ